RTIRQNAGEIADVYQILAQLIEARFLQREATDANVVPQRAIDIEPSGDPIGRIQLMRDLRQKLTGVGGLLDVTWLDRRGHRGDLQTPRAFVRREEVRPVFRDRAAQPPAGLLLLEL